MSSKKWNVTLRIFRKKGTAQPYFDDYQLEVDPEEYFLDAVERVWAFHDRTLTFSHACHHSTCGACGMRVNGVEKLTCITIIKDVTSDGGTVKIEPLRNFPIISDLVVDMGNLYRNMERVGHRSIVQLSREPAGNGYKAKTSSEEDCLRLSDCIECGICISACPIASTNPDYLGPAVLAGAQQCSLEYEKTLLDIVDSTNGVWRCHSACECTEVCPSFVEPGRKIMQLRRAVIGARLSKIFGSRD